MPSFSNVQHLTKYLAIPIPNFSCMERETKKVSEPYKFQSISISKDEETKNKKYLEGEKAFRFRIKSLYKHLNLFEDD